MDAAAAVNGHERREEATVGTCLGSKGPGRHVSCLSRETRFLKVFPCVSLLAPTHQTLRQEPVRVGRAHALTRAQALHQSVCAWASTAAPSLKHTLVFPGSP